MAKHLRGIFKVGNRINVHRKAFMVAASFNNELSKILPHF